MNAQLILNFDNQDDLLKVLQFLKDIGLDKIKLESNSFRKKEVIDTVPQAIKQEAYQQAQSLKGDVPQPVFSIDKYAVYGQ